MCTSAKIVVDTDSDTPSRFVLGIRKTLFFSFGGSVPRYSSYSYTSSLTSDSLRTFLKIAGSAVVGMKPAASSVVYNAVWNRQDALLRPYCDFFKSRHRNFSGTLLSMISSYPGSLGYGMTQGGAITEIPSVSMHVETTAALTSPILKYIP